MGEQGKDELDNTTGSNTERPENYISSGTMQKDAMAAGIYVCIEDLDADTGAYVRAYLFARYYAGEQPIKLILLVDTAHSARAFYDKYLSPTATALTPQADRCRVNLYCNSNVLHDTYTDTGDASEKLFAAKFSNGISNGEVWDSGSSHTATPNSNFTVSNSSNKENDSQNYFGSVANSSKMAANISYEKCFSYTPTSDILFLEKGMHPYSDKRIFGFTSSGQIVYYSPQGDGGQNF